MFCQNCGHENEADAKFCESCGCILGVIQNRCQPKSLKKVSRREWMSLPENSLVRKQFKPVKLLTIVMLIISFLLAAADIIGICVVGSRVVRAAERIGITVNLAGLFAAIIAVALLFSVVALFGILALKKYRTGLLIACAAFMFLLFGWTVALFFGSGPRNVIIATVMTAPLIIAVIMLMKINKQYKIFLKCGRG